LLIAMEGAAAETVRGLTADKDEDYDLIWDNLSRRFGHIDEPERAKRRFDNKKQLESETIEVFEQGLRTVFCEAWPTGDPKSKENDWMLQRRFIDGLFDPALQPSFTSMLERMTLSSQSPKPDSIWTPRNRPKSLPFPKMSNAKCQVCCHGGPIA